MNSSSSQASTTRRLTTTCAIALAVDTAATLATAPAFAAPHPVQDPLGFMVSPAGLISSGRGNPPMFLISVVT
ncbi:hypothetical protein QP958_07880 [Corynebacterium marquesiae]|uniref:hypothetical protein n=1 Tax=Corynebacterium TaxID=1716 RepID=UPI001EF48DD0|nr:MULTISPECIES: hypothetical protein [Corynebacterium]MCG7446584.1 hypothetical protein [Corynebacterium sp. ACRPO]MDK8455318.1 hypothetical protein [Corynebacterium marquesiae]MDK8669069.1 hypothetical protein [Corynebacterium marquesiae]MDK8725409.1 hypothetical protein [Corynebacterium marquesiae]MDK8770755.1 hypothetical protein [Corynebacterium marquesiae]